MGNIYVVKGKAETYPCVMLIRTKCITVPKQVMR